MNGYKIELKINCIKADADHFLNTVLMIAKGFNIEVLACFLGKNEQDSQPYLGSQTDTPMKTNLNINEAAEFLNISKQTLYKYTSEVTIPHYKLGSRILFKESELDEWLEEHKVDVI